MYAIISTIIFSLLGAWMVPALIIYRFSGIICHEITNISKIEQIKTRAKGRSSMVFNGKAHGLFILREPLTVGIISSSKSQYGDVSETAWVVSTKSAIKTITAEQQKEEDTNVASKPLTILERTGNYRYLHWCKRHLPVDSFQPWDVQKETIDKIVSTYKSRPSKSAVAFISGLPGCGKTTVGLLLAKQIGAKFADSFNPTDPGDSIETLYRQAKPTSDKPLVIVINEADIILGKVTHEIPRHKEIPIQICDKTTWNNFFDKFDVGMFPNTIIVMTSNTPAEDICDASFLRPGRVHLRCAMPTQE